MSWVVIELFAVKLGSVFLVEIRKGKVVVWADFETIMRCVWKGCKWRR
jgi:hypothetical protein